MGSHAAVAFSYDSGFHCRQDAMDRFGWCEEHNTLACGLCFTDNEGNTVGATFNWDEHTCGISCDTCLEPIIEHPDTNGKKCSECARIWDSGMELIEPSDVARLRAENDGSLPSIQFPQVMLYQSKSGGYICDECASRPDPLDPVVEMHFLGEEDSEPDENGFVNHLTCDGCSQIIDPACRTNCEHNVN